jgi:hypothetical protein
MKKEIKKKVPAGELFIRDIFKVPPIYARRSLCGRIYRGI